jgi:hypothetical protein
MTTTITSLIARSISHTEIAHGDMSDMINSMALEAEAAGDSGMARVCYAAHDEDDARGTVMQALRANVDGYEDDVVNGDTWEMWGTTDEGSEWRIAIDLTA